MDNTASSEMARIKELLKESPHGLSITEIAAALHKNKHSIGRYLDILHVSGHVEMRSYGKAKVFSLASRVPLSTVLGFSHDLVLVLDQDLRIIRANDPFLQMINKSRQEIVGKNISYIPFAGSRAETILEGIRESLVKGVPDQEIRPTDPGDEYFHVKNIPTVFENGERGTTVILEDVSAQKSAENALRSSEEQFRLLAENVRDGVLIKEGDKIVFANKRIEEIIGYSREELALMPPGHFAAPEDRERLVKTIEDFTGQGGVPSDLSFWIIRKDGKRRFIYSRSESIRREDLVTHYIVITDMTDWKVVQTRLENQLGFLQHLIDTFPSPLFYIDKKGRYLGCNSAFSRIIGKSAPEIIGQRPEDCMDSELAEFFSQRDTEVFAKKEIVTYSGVIQYTDGTSYEVSLQKSAFTSQEGEISGLIGLVVSERSEHREMMRIPQHLSRRKNSTST